MASGTTIPDRFGGRYWRAPAFLEYVHPALTDETVAAAEAQLGVKLPAAYLELLRQQNGGYLRARWPESPSDTLFGIGPRFPSITLDAAWWRPRNANAGRWAPTRPELLVAFDGDGHWDMCFDYRARGPREEPSVTLVDSEVKRERAIAPSFVDYLAGLADDLESGTRVYGQADPERVARRLAQHLGGAEPTLDTLGSGYPIWRVALPAHEWVWCSPNPVPAGFRRDGRRLIVTDETTLRVPEDRACLVLVSCTEKVQAAVAEALRASGFVGAP